MKNKYRIVRDSYCGYECQIKYWYFPFIWFELYFGNTSFSIERAKKIIENHSKKVVLYINDETI